MRSILPIAMILAMLAVGPLVALAQAPRGAAGAVIVIVAPWTDPAALVARSAGRLVGPEAAPMAVYAIGTGGDFAARLRGNGAWAVIDAAALAALCGG